jgi:hypothetical protein
MNEDRVLTISKLQCFEPHISQDYNQQSILRHNS